ncbi:MAG: hemolysin III family protein [Bacteroidota bacterium]
MKKSNEQIIFKEELINSLSHGLGLVFGIIAIPILTALAATKGSPIAIVGTAVYGFGFLFVYGSSTIYHGVTHPKAKAMMRVIDHISIFFMIAGSYTPFILAYRFDSFGITMLCIMWGIVLFGTIFKMIYAARFHIVSTVCYVVMGWMVIFFGKSLLGAMPVSCVVLLLVGGVLYSLGVVFFLWEKLRYNHAIWHAFVLLASVCHYVAVLLTLV